MFTDRIDRYAACAALPLAVVVSFCAVAFLFGLHEVARDLEEPFTTKLGLAFGANRLHAPLMQVCRCAGMHAPIHTCP